MSGISADFLRLYEEELEWFREGSVGFAKDHPGVAKALGLSDGSDPSVERLLEGVAFLSARVRLKLATSEQRLARELLANLVPAIAAPVPSVAIVALVPELGVNLMTGPLTVAKGSRVLATDASNADRSNFRTSQEVEIYPWSISRASYVGRASLREWRGKLPQGLMAGAQSALRIDLGIGQQAQAAGFAASKIDLFLGGSAAAPFRIFRALCTGCRGIAVLAGDGTLLRAGVGQARVEPVGFARDEALLDCGDASFDGHRLLTEFFLMPERFQFVRLHLAQGNEQPVELVQTASLTVLLLFSDDEAAVAEDVERVDWTLNATPVCNQYERRLDRLPWVQGQTDHALVADRLRATGQEILRLVSVSAIDKDGRAMEAAPAVGATGTAEPSGAPLYYHVARDIKRPWRLGAGGVNAAGEDGGALTSLRLSLVGPNGPVDTLNIEQVAVTALVCDGDTPWRGYRAGSLRWSIDAAGGLDVKVIKPPSACLRRHLLRDDPWAVVATLRSSLQSLQSSGQNRPLIEGLQELLRVFALDGSGRSRRTIDALRDARAIPAIRALRGAGPLACCRGVQVEIETRLDDLEAAPVFALSMVLDRFLAAYASINSFTELSFRTHLAESTWTWPARRGLGELL